jgi:type IV secretory pathway VirB2 component (pilin)
MKPSARRSRPSLAMTSLERPPQTRAAVHHPDAGKLRTAAFIALALLTLMPEMALAAPWDNVAQNVLDMFTGGLTRTIAIIAVIGCGIAALAGKLQWSWAINIILGIVLIFGGATFVDYMIAAAA